MSDAMFCAVCGHNPGGILGKFCLCEDCAAYADRKEHKVVFGLECDCRSCRVVRHLARAALDRHTTTPEDFGDLDPGDVKPPQRLTGEVPDRHTKDTG